MLIPGACTREEEEGGGRDGTEKRSVVLRTIDSTGQACLRSTLLKHLPTHECFECEPYALA